MKTNQKILMGVAFFATALFTTQAAEGSTPQASPSKFVGFTAKLLRKQVEEQAAEIDSLTKKVQELEEIRVEACLDKRGLESVLNAIREQLDTLAAEHEDVEQRIVDALAAKVSQERAIGTFRKRNEEVEQELSDVKGRLKDADYQIAQQNAHVRTLEASLREQKDLLHRAQRAGVKEDSDEKLRALLAKQTSMLEARGARITIQAKAIETQRCKIQELERLLTEHGIALPR